MLLMRLYSILISVFIFFLVGCSWVQFPSVHVVSFQQGNIVSQDMVNKLQTGMTKAQVQYILGSPLIVDTFNPSRWDYYYTRVNANKNKKQLTVIFDKENKLQKLEGDFMQPTHTEAED